MGNWLMSGVEISTLPAERADAVTGKNEIFVPNKRRNRRKKMILRCEWYFINSILYENL